LGQRRSWQQVVVGEGRLFFGRVRMNVVLLLGEDLLGLWGIGGLLRLLLLSRRRPWYGYVWSVVIRLFFDVIKLLWSSRRVITNGLQERWCSMHAHVPKKLPKIMKSSSAFAQFTLAITQSSSMDIATTHHLHADKLTYMIGSNCSIDDRLLAKQPPDRRSVKFETGTTNLKSDHPPIVSFHDHYHNATSIYSTRFRAQL
jgi:hypothetical protein